jgi:CRISPR-associated protein Cmr3
MTDYTYKISLKPIDDYYFGGERTFGGTGEKEQRNYFAYSNKYPQQTSIMGLVRYLLLEANELLPVEKNKTEASALIGKHSFNPKITEKAQDFGSIEKISPLFIAGGGAFFRFAHPMGLMTTTFPGEGEILVGNRKIDKIPSIKDFDPKAYYPDLFVPDRKISKKFLDEKSGKSIEGREGVFSKTVFTGQYQVGIQKGAENEGFFKQQFFRLNPGFEFVFFVKMKPADSDDPSKGIRLKNTIVFFGGEQRQFKVNVSSDKECQFPAFPQNEKGRKIILLSDAFVSEEILGHCSFALADIEEFRTGKFQENGYQFNGKSNKFNLLKRGGILFPKNENSKSSICKLLDSPLNYIQLGFNHYIIKE